MKRILHDNLLSRGQKILPTSYSLPPQLPHDVFFSLLTCFVIKGNNLGIIETIPSLENPRSIMAHGTHESCVWKFEPFPIGNIGLFVLEYIIGFSPNLEIGKQTAKLYYVIECQIRAVKQMIHQLQLDILAGQKSDYSSQCDDPCLALEITFKEYTHTQRHKQQITLHVTAKTNTNVIIPSRRTKY